MINLKKSDYVAQPKMRKFNKTVNIAVSLDMIAEQLLAQFAPESAHKEIIVEAIIGNLHNRGRLGQLYAALSGHKVEINFKVGDVLFCKRDAYNHNASRERASHSKIGVCKVIEIDEFGDDPIKIEHQEINSGNRVVTDYDWVSIDSLEATELEYGLMLPHPDAEKAEIA